MTAPKAKITIPLIPRQTVVPPATKATGFLKIPNAIMIESKHLGYPLVQVLIKCDDYARVLSLMCEGSSREGIDALHRLVSQRRMNAAGAR